MPIILTLEPQLFNPEIKPFFIICAVTRVSVPNTVSPPSIYVPRASPSLTAVSQLTSLLKMPLTPVVPNKPVFIPPIIVRLVY